MKNEDAHRAVKGGREASALTMPNGAIVRIVKRNGRRRLEALAAEPEIWRKTRETLNAMPERPAPKIHWRDGETDTLED